MQWEWLPSQVESPFTWQLDRLVPWASALPLCIQHTDQRPSASLQSSPFCPSGNEQAGGWSIPKAWDRQSQEGKATSTVHRRTEKVTFLASSLSQKPQLGWKSIVPGFWDHTDWHPAQGTVAKLLLSVMNVDWSSFPHNYQRAFRASYFFMLLLKGPEHWWRIPREAESAHSPPSSEYVLRKRSLHSGEVIRFSLHQKQWCLPNLSWPRVE